MEDFLKIYGQLLDSVDPLVNLLATTSKATHRQIIMFAMTLGIDAAHNRESLAKRYEKIETVRELMERAIGEFHP